MFQNKCTGCKIIGLTVSIIAAVILAVTIEATAGSYRWLRYLLVAIWILTALSLVGAFTVSLINVYNFNKRVSEMLKNNITLLVVGAVSAIISTAVLSLIVKTGNASVIALKVLSAVSAFAAGLVMSADLCFLDGIINGYCCRKKICVQTECVE